MSGKLVSAQIIEIVFSTTRRHILLHEREYNRGEDDYVQSIKAYGKVENVTHSQVQFQIMTVLPMGRKPSLIPVEARRTAEPLRHFGVDKTVLRCR